MSNPTTHVVDAAALPLVAFVRDAARYAASVTERDARRLAASPFSGVPHAEARALCAAAGERRTFAEAIERVPLAPDALPAARRFVGALGELAGAYRAQGATAAELIDTIAIAFGFAERLDAGERATIERLVALARRLDAEGGAAPFEAGDLVRALEDWAARCPAEVEPAPGEQPAPLEQRAPERPADVRRRRMHFSASSLGTFAECERRWFYRYVCAAVEDRGSSASFYGTAFHWALEKFHTEFPRAGGAAEDVLERTLIGYVNTAFERYRGGFETNVEYELQCRRARRTARRYLAWFLERSRAHPFEVIGTEANVELELGGHAFVGYIDRLDRDDATGAVTVIDYKTGSIAESADEYRAKVAAFLDFQLPFYYWARTAAGDRVTRLALVPLKDALREVRPIELEVVLAAAPRSYGGGNAGVIGIDELERARTRMIELAEHLTNARIERFRTTDDPARCGYCAYLQACRDRPLQREERFGR
jgi:RecB family exonuclease